MAGLLHLLLFTQYSVCFKNKKENKNSRGRIRKGFCCGGLAQTLYNMAKLSDSSDVSHIWGGQYPKCLLRLLLHYFVACINTLQYCVLADLEGEATL